jgi:hypothetical protein
MTCRYGLIAIGVLLGLACVAWGQPDLNDYTTYRPKVGAEPEEVRFFIYILDIDAISGQDQNFTVNVSLVLKWIDPRLVHDDPTSRIVPREKVWSPTIVLANRQALLRMPLPEVVEVAPDGLVTYRQQYVGALSQPLSLKNFPLDVQDFTIHFIAVDAAPDEITFVPMEIPEANISGGGIAEVLSLPDWTVRSFRAEPKPLDITGVHQVPGFAFTFIARRHFAYYFWQAIVPLLLIVMMSWVPFWVPPSKAELQFGIASSAVLTLIAYRFTLATMLPKLPYLTRLDYVSTGGTILVFMAFLQVLVTSLLAKNERERLALRIDFSCRFVFPIVFIGLLTFAVTLGRAAVQ